MSRLTNKWKVILSSILVIVFAISAFFTVNLILGSGSVTAEDIQGMVLYKQFDTPEEASSYVGYKVVTPQFLPPDISYKHTISVIDTPTTNNIKRVEQYWNYGKKQFISLIQWPGNGELAGGESTTVNGVTGAKTFAKESVYGSGQVSLFWKIGDMTYLLSATTNESVNEETIYQIANSTKEQ